MAISSLEVEHLAVTFPNPTLYKLVVGVNVSTIGGLCLCVSPVIDSRPVQDVPRLSPYGNWDSFQPPAHDPELDKRKRETGCMKDQRLRVGGGVRVKVQPDLSQGILKSWFSIRPPKQCTLPNW